MKSNAELSFDMQKDAAFVAFVDNVSPRENGVQPVFWAELFLILKILWEIYSWMKAAGWFKKWITVYRVKAAMKIKNIAMREAVLTDIKEHLA